MTQVRYTLIDLFAGAGGLSCGLVQAGFNPLLATDIKPICEKTYKENHPDTIFITRDIREFKGSDILDMANLKKGDLDLLAGGPPCQGFSVNAPMRSWEDERNHLFKNFLNIADELGPKVILIENVPGIVSFAKGGVVRAIYTELEKMGYKVDHKILFAGHYGVPQLRFRTVFIATRLDSDINFPKPTHYSSGRTNFARSKELCFQLHSAMESKLKKQVTIWDAISDLPEINPENKNFAMDYSEKPRNEYQLVLRQKSDKVLNHNANRLATINLERLKHIPQGGSWRDIPIELLPNGLKRARRSDHTKRYGRLHPNSLCSTIMTKCDPHWGSFFHPYQNRVLSAREAARIQSFPDDFIFCGSLTEQYEQIGNAVPPLMAKQVGESIMNMLNQTICKKIIIKTSLKSLATPQMI